MAASQGAKGAKYHPQKKISVDRWTATWAHWKYISPQNCVGLKGIEKIRQLCFGAAIIFEILYLCSTTPMATKGSLFSKGGRKRSEHYKSHIQRFPVANQSKYLVSPECGSPHILVAHHHWSWLPESTAITQELLQKPMLTCDRKQPLICKAAPTTAVPQCCPAVRCWGEEAAQNAGQQ